jgi:cation transport regulator ChaB
MKLSPILLAWHFIGDTLHDGRPVPLDGEKLVHQGELRMCAIGLHASRRIIDGLRYASGDTLCRVRCRGQIIQGSDKLVCSERTILWRVDAERILRRFAKDQALQVAHLWDMPQVVRQYLESNNEDLSFEAYNAARSAIIAKARNEYSDASLTQHTAAYSAVHAAMRAASYNALSAAADAAANAADAASADALEERILRRDALTSAQEYGLRKMVLAARKEAN